LFCCCVSSCCRSSQSASVDSSPSPPSTTTLRAPAAVLQHAARTQQPADAGKRSQQPCRAGCYDVLAPRAHARARRRAGWKYPLSQCQDINTHRLDSSLSSAVHLPAATPASGGIVQAFVLPRLGHGHAAGFLFSSRTLSRSEGPRRLTVNPEDAGSNPPTAACSARHALPSVA